MAAGIDSRAPKPRKLGRSGPGVSPSRDALGRVALGPGQQRPPDSLAPAVLPNPALDPVDDLACSELGVDVEVRHEAVGVLEDQGVARRLESWPRAPFDLEPRPA